MSHGLDSDLHFQIRAWFCEVAFHGSESNEFLQRWRPGCRGCFPDLRSVFVNRYCDARRGSRHCGRQADFIMNTFHAHPVDFESHDLAKMAMLLLLDQRVATDEPCFFQIDEAAETQLEWRVFLPLYKRLLAAVEVDIDQQQAGFDARHIEREHASGMQVEGRAFRHKGVP